MTTCGLVLAAGRSSRFGAEDKLLADLNGHPLAHYAAAAMCAVPLDRRIVVTGSQAVADLFQGFQVVMLDNSGTVQSDSLRAGVTAARGADRLLIALADMPFVTPAHLAAVLERCGAIGSASTDGTRPMPPACFPATRHDALAELSGDKGAAPLLRALPKTALIPAPFPVLFDVDTPETLSEARKTGHASQGIEREP